MHNALCTAIVFYLCVVVSDSTTMIDFLSAVIFCVCTAQPVEVELVINSTYSHNDRPLVCNEGIGSITMTLEINTSLNTTGCQWSCWMRSSPEHGWMEMTSEAVSQLFESDNGSSSDDEGDDGWYAPWEYLEDEGEDDWDNDWNDDWDDDWNDGWEDDDWWDEDWGDEWDDDPDWNDDFRRRRLSTAHSASCQVNITAQHPPIGEDSSLLHGHYNCSACATSEGIAYC